MVGLIDSVYLVALVDSVDVDGLLYFFDFVDLVHVVDLVDLRQGVKRQAESSEIWHFIDPLARKSRGAHEILRHIAPFCRKTFGR